MGHVIISSIILSIFAFAPYGFAEVGGQHIPGTHVKVSGVVSKVQSGALFIKTSRGQMTASAGGLKGFKIGDEVDVWMNESNTVIEVRRASVKMNVRERPLMKSAHRSGADAAVTKIDPGLIF